MCSTVYLAETCHLPYNPTGQLLWRRLQYHYSSSSLDTATKQQCGLRIVPIANIVQFCYGYYIGKDLIKLDVEFFREHLVHCLERQQMTPFPSIETKAKLNMKKTIYVDISCDCTKCRLPNLMQEMVGCDAGKNKCNVCRHLGCADGQDETDDWFCTPHRRNHD